MAKFQMYFLILLSIIILSQSTKYSFPFAPHFGKLNLLCVPIHISKTTFQIPIDINSNITWIRKNGTLSLPETYGIHEQCVVPSKAQPEVGDVSFSKTLKFSDFAYYQIPPDDKDCLMYNSTLGLAKHFDNSSFSLAEKFNQMKLTTSFSLSLMDPLDFVGDLRFGNFTDEIEAFPDQVINVDLIKDDPKWSLNLSGVVIGDLTNDTGDNNTHYKINATDIRYREINEKIVIDTLQQFILTTEPFMYFLRDKVFKRYINIGICTYERHDNRNFYGFLCSDEILVTFPSVYLIFNNFLVELDSTLLFKKLTTHSYLFSILYCPDNPTWVLGHVVLKDYKIIFNSESGIVSFMGNNKAERISIVGEGKPKEEEKKPKTEEEVIRISPLNGSFVFSFGTIIMINLIGVTHLIIGLLKHKTYTLPIIQ